MAPQLLQVLRCYSCETFQSQIKKKVNKWECKVCKEKQSVLKVFFTGGGMEARKMVQELNLRRGQLKEEQYTTFFTNNATVEKFTIHDENKNPEICMEQRDKMAKSKMAANQPVRKSKWTVYTHEYNETMQKKAKQAEAARRQSEKLKQLEREGLLEDRPIEDFWPLASGVSSSAVELPPAWETASPSDGSDQNWKDGAFQGSSEGFGSDFDSFGGSGSVPPTCKSQMELAGIRAKPEIEIEQRPLCEVYIDVNDVMKSRRRKHMSQLDFLRQANRLLASSASNLKAESTNALQPALRTENEAGLGSDSRLTEHELPSTHDDGHEFDFEHADKHASGSSFRAPLKAVPTASNQGQLGAKHRDAVKEDFDHEFASHNDEPAAKMPQWTSANEVSNHHAGQNSKTTFSFKLNSSMTSLKPKDNVISAKTKQNSSRWINFL